MNEDTIAVCIVVGVVLLLVACICVVAVDYIYYKPYRWDEAQQICMDRGFDNYMSENGRILTTRALGVRCNYEGYTRKDISIEEDEPYVITGG